MKHVAAAAAFVAVAAVVFLVHPDLAAAFNTRIDSAQIERAVRLGRSADDSDLARFNDPYILTIGDPTFVKLEIVTEFRRAVLEAAKRTRLNSGWGVREATEMLRPYRGTVTLVLKVVLPPLNTYRSMPSFGVVLYPRGSARRLQPRDVRVIPQYISGQLASPGSPVLGGLIEATFAADRLDRSGACLVGLFEEGRERRRVEVNFGGID